MAGEAPDTGESVLLGALTGILGALTSQAAPVQQPVTVAPSQATPMGLGIPLSTLAILLVGGFVVFQILK